MNYMLGRIAAPDERDKKYRIRSMLEPRPLRLWRYWNDLQWWGDQGENPWCVAYAWLHALEDGPRTIKGKGPVIPPHELYKAAQQNDEWAGEGYDGTSVRGGAKALAAAGRIAEYRWAWDIDTVVEALLNVGPLVVGTNWYRSMFEPEYNGDLLVAKGSLAGGHAYVLNGVNLKRGLLRVKNSWGRSWAGDGRAWMEIETFERLLNEDGEACIGIESTT